jgi:hypothetical protein
VPRRATGAGNDARDAVGDRRKQFVELGMSLRGVSGVADVEVDDMEERAVDQREAEADA